MRCMALPTAMRDPEDPTLPSEPSGADLTSPVAAALRAHAAAMSDWKCDCISASDIGCPSLTPSSAISSSAWLDFIERVMPISPAIPSELRRRSSPASARHEDTAGRGR